MRVIAVTAHLARPAVINGPIHLDALMSARHPAMHNRAETVTRKSSGRVAVAPLTLATARICEVWVWCASAVMPSTDAAVALVKRRDGVDYRMTQRTVYPAVGPDRDRLVRFATTLAPLTWLAAVADGAAYKELRRICRRVDQIGGLRKSGYGLVECWEFAEVDQPPEDCLLAVGYSRRTLPAEMLETNAAPGQEMVIPPYWATAEARPAYLPGTEGRLCSRITIS